MRKEKKNPIFFFWKLNFLESPYQKEHEWVSLFMTNLIVKGKDSPDKFCYSFFAVCHIAIIWLVAIIYQLINTNNKLLLL